MIKFSLTIALLVQCCVIFAQDKNTNPVILIGTHGYYTVDSIPPNDTVALNSEGILTAYETKDINLSEVSLIFLSACNTAEKFDSLTKDYKKCFVGFIGCDETRESMSYFSSAFYREYITHHNTQIAFDKALVDFKKKYPESTVTPVLKCRE